jgi:hypothetical protein
MAALRSTLLILIAMVALPATAAVGEIITPVDAIYEANFKVASVHKGAPDLPIDLDLGGVFDLTDVHIWNYSHPTNQFLANTRDSRELEFFLSTDGTTYTSVGIVTMVWQGTSLDEPSQTFPLVGRASHVRFHIRSSFGDTEADVVDVRYKRNRKKVEIKIQAKRRSTRVTLTGPDEDALRTLWAEALARGGFAVEDGDIVKLIGRQDRRDDDSDSGDHNSGKRRGDVRFRFDGDLRLIEAHTPNPLLVACATDASGNKSTIVHVQPPHRSRDAAKRALTASSAGQGIQAYPNPFNSSTQIAYEVKQTGPTSIVIYNAMGQIVRELLRQNHLPGFYQVAWDGRDASGREVASGIYIYRLTTPSAVVSKRMTLLQ